MKKAYLGSVLFFLIVACSFVVLGCGEETLETGGKTITLLSILPTSASLEVGQQQAFSVTATYSDGTGSSPSASWSVTGGIGSITVVGLNAIFTAIATGSGTVVAEYRGKSAAANVTVTAESGGTGEAGVLQTINVSPAAKVMRIGDSETFTAAGVDGSGEAIPISPGWMLSGDAIGVLSSSGAVATLEARAEGTATINCISGEVIGYAYVTVEGYAIEITVESDTYVDEAHAADTHGSDTSLKAGYVSATDRYYETYLKFPLDRIPAGASVESAVLRVYPSSAGSSALQLKKLDAPFSDSTTWESRPALGSLVAAGVYTAGDYNNVSDDRLTRLVRDWKSGASANYGLAIVQEGSENGTVVILSLDNGSNYPMLRIEYTTY